MKENINYGEARRQQILKGFTNIEECAEETPIEKARHGVYADNAQNRRLQRVGQEYGHAAQEKPEAEQDNGGGVPEANVSLQNHARQASEEALVKVANDPSADAEMRKVATAELERRGVSVRAKNKNGDTSLRNGLADDEIADMIENMFEEAGTRVPREAKKEFDNLRGSGESVLAKWDAYTSESGGDDDFGAALDRLIDNKGEAKTIKELAAAIKTSGQGEAAQSDILDDEIADEIANIFEEAGIDLSKKGQATLDKMRADSNGDGKVSSAESLVQSFDDMAENDTDFDTKGFKSFVKQKGDAAAIKELAAAMKANPADASGAQSDATDDEIADTIANMFEMAGVKVSKDGQKELDALIGGEEESANKQGEKAKAEVKSAEKGTKAKTDKAAKSSPEKDNAAADKFIKKTDRGADPAEYAKMIAKNPEGIARALKARIASGDKEAQRAALSLNSLTDPQSRDQGVGQELLSHPELKKIADERQAARDSLRGVYDPDEYRKKVDAQLEVMKRTNKEFVDKFLEIYGGNTEE